MAWFGFSSEDLNMLVKSDRTMMAERDFTQYKTREIQKGFASGRPEGVRNCICSPTPPLAAAVLLTLVIVPFIATITYGLGNSLLVSNFTRFSSENLNEPLPKEWAIKVWKGQSDVKLVQENEKKVLRLRSQKSSISLYRKLKLNLKNFPILKWRWKVTKLPKNADARLPNRDDQAAGVYVVFPRFPSFINSRVIGYVWESSVPEGRILKSQKNPMVHYIVVRSGSKGLGKWLTEERNVMEDYWKVYGQEPPAVGGVFLMIDSDDTRSQAESYFARIEFKNHASARLDSDTTMRTAYLTP